MLISASSVDCNEEKLALAVVLKAVDDIGVAIDYSVGGNAGVDSTACIREGGLDVWLEAVSIDKSYFHRILKMTGLRKHGLV